MSTSPVLVTDKTAWIRDLVFLAFPEGEARERVLIDLVQQFSKMDPEDPEWLRYKLSVVECRALENVALGLNDAVMEQARLRSVTREIADFAATQVKGTIEEAGVTTRQLLEDVQASLHDSIAGEAILRCYTEETRQQFAAVIRTIIESSLTQALATSQKQMDRWLKGALDKAIRNAQDALEAVTQDFRVKLLGAWSYLLWSVIAGGILCGFGLLVLGYWLGSHL
jgi:phosphoribosylanthranilate isomerase